MIVAGKATLRGTETRRELTYRSMGHLPECTFVMDFRHLRPATLASYSVVGPMFFRTQYSIPRRWPRQWWNNSVEVFTGSAHVKALGMNISVGGMGIFAVANLHVGSPIEIEFESPQSGKRHRLHAIIRHRALYLYGVEFVNQRQFALAGSAGSA